MTPGPHPADNKYAPKSIMILELYALRLLLLRIFIILQGVSWRSCVCLWEGITFAFWRLVSGRSLSDDCLRCAQPHSLLDQFCFHTGMRSNDNFQLGIHYRACM